jgi:hypothetical protein
MFARVVRWEGGNAEAITGSIDEIRAQADAGPPPGVPAKGLLILQDLEGGKVISIGLFETEADYREGDETLNSMSPPGEGLGSRTAVEKYEVALELEA